MIKIITGLTGEGKTKLMIEAANKKVNSLKGNAIYIDSNINHRYALAHQIRLIEASAFPLKSRSSFMGFLYGIISANHDIEVVFIDELFKLTQCSIDEISTFFEEIKTLSERYQIEFVIGTCCSRNDLPQHLTPYLIA